MKKSKFTDEQIAFALKQAETGTPVKEVIRKMRITDRWKKKYGGLGPSEVRRLKQLEEKNRRLKQMVANGIFILALLIIPHACSKLALRHPDTTIRHCQGKGGFD